jgi:hypothetical protein
LFFYLFLFGITVFLSLGLSISHKINTRGETRETRNISLWFLIVLIFTLFYGFRYQVGTDFNSYVRYFERLQMGQPPNLEWGFSFVNQLAIALNFDYWFVFMICAGVTNYLVLKFLNDESPYFFLSVIILFGTNFFFFQTNGVRQAVAIAFTFYGTKYIIDRNLVKYVVFCLIGASFHYVALMMLPMYWLAGIKWGKSFLLIFIGFAFFTFLYPGTPRYMAQILPRITPAIYQHYVERVLSRPGYVTTGLRIIAKGLLAFLLILYIPKDWARLRKNIIFSNLCIYGFVLQMFVARFWALHRTYHFFRLYQVIFIPYLLCNLKIDKTQKTFLIALTFLFYTSLTVVEIYKGSSGILPYRMIFFK